MKETTLKITRITFEKSWKDKTAFKRLEELGKKISKVWKTKKTATELIKEARR